MVHLIENKMKYFSAVFLLLISVAQIKAQNYHAVQGSSFAGSLGVSNNPASIVNTPYPWDVDLFSIQLKSATNAYTVGNYSLLSSVKKSTAEANAGDYKRFADVNFNINLLNARIALNRKQAIAIGFNMRGYGRLKTSAYNYNDTLQNTNEFFSINNSNSLYSGNFIGSSWLEAFATYSQTIWDDTKGRLNAGITVKGMRGISGAFAQLQNGAVDVSSAGSSQIYTLKSADAKYVYSYNYDSWQKSKSSTQNVKDFIENTRGAFSADIGVEYLIKSQALSTIYDEDDYYDYEWKIGISLLDLGYNKYRPGNKSRSFTAPAANVTDTLLDQKFNSPGSFQNFNDSLATIVNGFSPITGKFRIQNPTRLVINVDRPLGNDFYMNGELSINLSSAIISANKLYVQELNLLTITPRWETKRWGVYLPIQYTVDKQFWIGSAFKAGPLLFGIHNWASVFSKTKIQNGGGYLAIVIHPSSMTKKKTDKRLDCPPGL
jgi:hypothetical protein